MAQATKELVQKIYVAFLGRPADAGGLDYWVQVDEDTVLQSIPNCDESVKLYSDATTNIEKVNKIYKFVLGREGDIDGLHYWATQVDNGTPLATVAISIMNAAAQNDNEYKDSTRIANKLAAADNFTEKLRANPVAEANYEKNPHEGGVFLDKIGADTTATQIDAYAAESVKNIAENQTTGDTFTLTADLTATAATLMSDANVGFSNAEKFLTNSNDTINLLAVDASAGNKNVTIIDDSTADNDVVKIILDSTTDITNLKTTNIETLELTNSGYFGTAQDFVVGSGFSGLTTINLKGAGFSNTGSGLDIKDLTSAVTVNGTAKDDVIKVDVGYKTGTVINGGAGDDTVSVGASAAATVNFAKSALSSVENLIMGATGSEVSFWEGAGVKNVTLAAGSAKAVLNGNFTNQTDDVKRSGDFYINNTDKELTYFDNVVGDVVTIGFTKTDGDPLGTVKLVANKDAGTITAELAVA